MVPQRLQLVTLTGAAWQKWLCLAACTTTPLTTPPYCHASSQGNICKHILFVMLRVLHMSPDEPLVWQKALLASEVDEVGQQLLGTAAAPLIVRLVAALLVRPFVAHEFLDSQPHN